jgi:hypothetical protein
MSYCSHGFDLKSFCPHCGMNQQGKESNNESYRIRTSDYYYDDRWEHRRPSPSMVDIENLQHEIRDLKHQISKLQGFIDKLMDVFLPGHKK